MPMSQLSIRGQIASAITIVVQVERLHDGTRRLVSVTEITGMEGDVVQMQEIMRFQKLGVDEQNRVKGQFRATGIRPRFLERIAELGFQLPAEIFEPSRPLA